MRDRNRNQKPPQILLLSLPDIPHRIRFHSSLLSATPAFRSPRRIDLQVKHRQRPFPRCLPIDLFASDLNYLMRSWPS